MQAVHDTHFIDELARNLNLPENLKEKIMDLTIDYTFARYPDVSERVPYEEYTEEVAMEKLEIAKEVLEYFKKRWGEL